MKKIVLFFSCIFMLLGCSKFDDKDLINDLNKKISSVKSYQITANLDIYRNEEKFSYDIISTYQKEDKFKVELINKENNHKQIILKNSSAVYVLTPSLNKSFKFQSDWPYNNSQIYLLQPIISDIEKDDNRVFVKEEKSYKIISSVNYSNEKNFVKQNVYFDSNGDITKVEVLDKSDNVKMNLEIINIEYDIELKSDFFEINEYEEKDSSKETLDTFNIEEIVYPMYVPAETYLTSQDVIETENGERVILTFSGESQFILIQENSLSNEKESYVYGDPYLILDTIGSMTDTSVSWISNGVEYSVISDTMSVDELLTVAQSIGVQPVGK